jgi:hypothetical protein
MGGFKNPNTLPRGTISTHTQRREWSAGGVLFLIYHVGGGIAAKTGGRALRLTSANRTRRHGLTLPFCGLKTRSIIPKTFC